MSRLVPLLSRGYVALRRATRNILRNRPLVDRWLGDWFRRLDRWIPPRRILSIGNGPLLIGDLVIHHRPEDEGVVLPLFCYGDYETETRAYIVRFLGPGMAFVDLGAHIGFFTLLAAQAVGPTGIVYAFEPVPATFSLLQRNVEENGYGDIVRAVPLAAWNKKDRLRMYLNEEASVSAKMMPQGDEGGQSIEVDTSDLDGFFESMGWPDVSLVKMDVEGVEIEVLEGMRRLNRRNPRLKLIAEINGNHLRQRGRSVASFVSLLRREGFRRFTVLHQDGFTLDTASHVDRLDRLAKRANLNVLCEKEA